MHSFRLGSALVLLLVACTDHSVPTPTEAGAFFAKEPFVAVTPDAATLTTEGQTIQLNATARNGKSVAWSSSDISVAVVNSSGIVTATGEGTASITASVGPHSGAASITVDFP